MCEVNVKILKFNTNNSMKKILFGLMFLGAALILGSCNVHKVSTEAYYSTKCVYLNDEGDGSITVRAYGRGAYRNDAVEQARKNAVRQVIFEGVDVPGNVSLSRPLILEVNAAEKYESFFNNFFKDDGPYTQFFARKDRRLRTNEKVWTDTQVKIATTIRIFRSDLKEYLKENNIIK